MRFRGGAYLRVKSGELLEVVAKLWVHSGFGQYANQQK